MLQNAAKTNHNRKILSQRLFIMTGHTLGFLPQTTKVELPLIKPNVGICLTILKKDMLCTKI